MDQLARVIAEDVHADHHVRRRPLHHELERGTLARVRVRGRVRGRVRVRVRVRVTVSAARPSAGAPRVSPFRYSPG